MFIVFIAVYLSWSVLNSATEKKLKCSNEVTLNSLLTSGIAIHFCGDTTRNPHSWRKVNRWERFLGIFIIFYLKNLLSFIGAGISIIVWRGIYIYSTGKNSQRCYRHARTLRYCHEMLRHFHVRAPEYNGWTRISVWYLRNRSSSRALNFPGSHKILRVFF
jgi:hypothetical protein